MAFLETPRFPENIAFNAVGGPTYLTSVVTVSSGLEQRNSLWTFARMVWDVGQVTAPLSSYGVLIAFFRAVGGKRTSFRFKDFTDFTEAMPAGSGASGVLGLTGLGDGTTTVFQMVKNYPTGALTDQRLIRKPISGTCAFFDNGSPVSPTVDYTTGLVTFGSPPTTGHTLTWTGQFDVPVRFDTDDMKYRIVNRQGAAGELLVDWPSIPLIEDRNA
jgi:uncharacterized protein (TIGR02217 family)